MEATGVIGSSSPSPDFYLEETDQTVDGRIWRLTTGGGNFFVQTLNDAGTNAQQGFVITRDRTTINRLLMNDDTIAVYVGAKQNVAIGHAASSTRLHVNGPVRVGQYAKASLPSAQSVSAGSIANVTDTAGGWQLAFSDGLIWRTTSDRVVL